MDKIQGNSFVVILINCARPSKRVCVSQAQHRWQPIINEELIKGPWTAEEDQKVQLHPNTAVNSKMDGCRAEEKNFPSSKR